MTLFGYAPIKTFRLAYMSRTPIIPGTRITNLLHVGTREILDTPDAGFMGMKVTREATALLNLDCWSPPSYLFCYWPPAYLEHESAINTTTTTSTTTTTFTTTKKGVSMRYYSSVKGYSTNGRLYCEKT